MIYLFTMPLIYADQKEALTIIYTIIELLEWIFFSRLCMCVCVGKFALFLFKLVKKRKILLQPRGEKWNAGGKTRWFIPFSIYCFRNYVILFSQSVSQSVSLKSVVEIQHQCNVWRFLTAHMNLHCCYSYCCCYTLHCIYIIQIYPPQPYHITHHRNLSLQ